VRRRRIAWVDAGDALVTWAHAAVETAVSEPVSAVKAVESSLAEEAVPTAAADQDVAAASAT
jgi:hypothetical protein